MSSCEGKFPICEFPEQNLKEMLSDIVVLWLTR